MKKNLNSLLGILFCLALLLGCGGGGGGGGGGNPTGPAGSGEYVNFGGTVSYNGAPMEGAGVYLVNPDKAFDAGVAKAAAALKASILADVSAIESFGDYRTVSNNTGQFSFNSVAAGDYTLIAVKGAHQVVKTGLKINGSVTTVDVALAPTGNLSGLVTISGETDVSGVIVYLEGTSFVSLTDSTGLFRFLNVPAGTYSVRARRDYYGMSTAVPVTAVAAVDTSVSTLSLTSQITPPTTATTTVTAIFGTVSGTATKAGQTSSSGIIAHLQGTEFITVTTSTGNYTLSYVPPGNYTVNFYAGGYNDGSPQTITVPSTGGTVTVPAVTLSSTSPGGVVTGTLSAVAGVYPSGHINLFQQGVSKPVKITQIGLNGTFEFTGVSAGNYYVQLAQSTGYTINQAVSYFALADGQKVTQNGLPVIVLVPGSVNPNSIVLQVQQDKITVVWDGISEVSSYAVYLYANGNTTTPVASKLQVYGSQADLTRPPTPVRTLKAGIVVYSNGAASSLILNPNWVPGYLDLTSPQIVDTGYTGAGFKDTMVGNGCFYYLATDAVNCFINKMDLTSLALTSGPNFTTVSDMYGTAGSTGIYAIVSESNLKMYKFGFDLSANAANPYTVAAGAGVDPKTFEAPDGMIYAFWLQPGGSPYVMKYASGTDFNALGAGQTETSFSGPTNISGVTAARTFDNRVLYIVTSYDGGSEKLVVQGQSQIGINLTRRIETFNGNFYLLHNYSAGENAIDSRSPLTPTSEVKVVNVREQPIDFVIDPLGRFWVISKSITAAPYSLYLQVYSNSGELLKETTLSVQTNTPGMWLSGRRLLNYDPVTKKVVLGVPSNTGTLKVLMFDASPVNY